MLAEDIEQQNLENQEALEHHHITSKVLDEYIADKPLVETIRKLRGRLDKVTRQRDSYGRELEEERIGKMVDKELDSIIMGTADED